MKLQFYWDAKFTGFFIGSKEFTKTFAYKNNDKTMEINSDGLFNSGTFLWKVIIYDV